MENIEVIANAGNIYLLINKKDYLLSNCKAVSILNNEIDEHTSIKTYDNIQTPLTFNAFTEIPKNQRGDFMLILMRKTTENDSKIISDFLK